MKLYLMKQEALDFLKSNLKTVFGKYYTETSNAWIKELYGDDPFIEFMDVTEFKLADLDAGFTPGEIDLNNCKIIYEKLSFLSESQASDERLWAGLTHATFYEYMRKRWKYGYGNKPKTAEKEAGAIKTRFFYGSSGRSGFYRNTLAKCWWVGHNTFDSNNTSNHFEALDVIGANDLNSKINEFFYNFTFSSNPTIRTAIIDSLRQFKADGKKLLVREHIRPAMSQLNAVGGSVVIDCLETEEISRIFSDSIEAIMQGDAPVITVDDSYDDDDYGDSAEPFTQVAETADGQAAEELPEEAGEEPIGVALGCTVTIENQEGETHSYKYDFRNGKWPPFLDIFTDKAIGDEIDLNDEIWTINSIEFE